MKKNRRILPKELLNAVSNSFNSLADLLVKLHASPNLLTVFALLAGMAAGAMFALGKPLWAIAAVMICGIFDVLDGKVAVRAQKTSLFGAIFDSTLDRYSEFFMYLGIAVFFRHHWGMWLVFFTFLGSSMVSYTRARAEGLGIECKVGIMQRAERLVLITLGTLIGVIFGVLDYALLTVMGLIAVISHITAMQRTFHVKRVEKSRTETSKPEKS